MHVHDGEKLYSKILMTGHGQNMPVSQIFLKCPYHFTNHMFLTY